MYPIRIRTFAAMLIFSSCLVGAISLTTNHLPTMWDMIAYVYLARYGVSGFGHVAAPFVYRFLAPLTVGAFSRAFHLDPEVAFRAGARLASVCFAMSCFYFAKGVRVTSNGNACMIATVLTLYFWIAKWSIFAGAMVDIYAYPLVLLAFWLAVRRRIYLCILVSGLGMFCKEFLLLPILAQFAVLLSERRVAPTIKIAGTATATGVALFLCFLLPRVLIPVYGTSQAVDPINDPRTLVNLIVFPLQAVRDLNIVFAYAAFWLPTLALFTRERGAILKQVLSTHQDLIRYYLLFHFALVMYGGTNLTIFVAYSVPVQILALTVLLGQGKISGWEKVLVFVAVFVFNREWCQIPLPAAGPFGYITLVEYYGGFSALITPRCAWRMVELICWLALFPGIRVAIRKQTGRAAPAVIASLYLSVVSMSKGS